MEPLYLNNPKLYHREHYYKQREAIFEYLGNVCVVCGSKENLQVDHKNKNDKLFNIAKRLSVKNNKEELDKCQTLCKDCHLEKTILENSGFEHGTLYAWMKKKCICEECYKSKREWHRIRNAKRRIGKGYKERF